MGPESKLWDNFSTDQMDSSGMGHWECSNVLNVSKDFLESFGGKFQIVTF